MSRISEQFSFFIKKYPISSILVKLVCYYVFIRLLIYSYIGISTPGGEISLHFFEKTYVIPYYIRFILIPIQFGFELLGYTITPIRNGLMVLGRGGIFVEFACIGLAIMAAWVALILAFPGKKKVTFLFIGLLFIHTLNSIRIASVFYADITYPDKNYVALSHELYNYIGYTLIVGLFYVWRARQDQ